MEAALINSWRSWAAIFCVSAARLPCFNGVCVFHQPCLAMYCVLTGAKYTELNLLLTGVPLYAGDIHAS